MTTPPSTRVSNVGAPGESPTNERKIIVMGPAGSGKTTIGRRLAEARGLSFVDADDHHPSENIEKMRAGIGLSDEDRAPWLSRLGEVLRSTPRVVLACSALRRSYRNALREAEPAVTFIYLRVAEAELARRLSTRAGHYAKGSLLSGQLGTLEEPLDEPDAIVLDANQGEDDVLERVISLVLL